MSSFTHAHRSCHCFTVVNATTSLQILQTLGLRVGVQAVLPCCKRCAGMGLDSSLRFSFTSLHASTSSYLPRPSMWPEHAHCCCTLYLDNAPGIHHLQFANSPLCSLQCSEYEELQHRPNEHMDSFLDEEFRRRHLASHDRPALEDCTEEEFEADLCEFLRQRQEPALAKAVTEHRITW